MSIIIPIILPWRLLHSPFEFKVLFSADYLHVECCSATLSVWMPKFIVLQRFRRSKILCMLDKHGPLNETFWFLLFTQSDYSYLSFLGAPLETTKSHLNFFPKVQILHNLHLDLYSNHIPVLSPTRYYFARWTLLLVW